MEVEEVRTGLDIDENYETLAVTTKKDGKWEIDIFQMPVVSSKERTDTK
jgi:hypothetical protein